jgi:hypothetical protein
VRAAIEVQRSQLAAIEQSAYVKLSRKLSHDIVVAVALSMVSSLSASASISIEKHSFLASSS